MTGEQGAMTTAAAKGLDPAAREALAVHLDHILSQALDAALSLERDQKGNDVATAILPVLVDAAGDRLFRVFTAIPQQPYFARMELVALAGLFARLAQRLDIEAGRRPMPGTCFVCGCSEERACSDGGEWVNAGRTLCSRCAETLAGGRP